MTAASLAIATTTALIFGPLAALMLAGGFLCLRSAWRGFARPRPA